MTSTSIAVKVNHASATLVCVWLAAEDLAHPLVCKWLEADESTRSRSVSVAGPQFRANCA